MYSGLFLEWTEDQMKLNATASPFSFKYTKFSRLLYMWFKVPLTD